MKTHTIRLKPNQLVTSGTGVAVPDGDSFRLKFTRDTFIYPSRLIVGATVEEDPSAAGIFDIDPDDTLTIRDGDIPGWGEGETLYWTHKEYADGEVVTTAFGTLTKIPAGKTASAPPDLGIGSMAIGYTFEVA